jgi:hypothetical protein
MLQVFQLTSLSQQVFVLSDGDPPVGDPLRSILPYYGEKVNFALIIVYNTRNELPENGRKYKELFLKRHR